MGRASRGSGTNRRAPLEGGFLDGPLPQPCRLYGATSLAGDAANAGAAASPLTRELSFNNMASEQGQGQGQLSVVSPAAWKGRERSVGESLRRALAAAAVLAVFFTAAVSILGGDRALSKPAVMDVVRDSNPSVVAKGRKGGGASSSSGLRSLEISASNEYGEFDKNTLTMYGLEMVIEPFRQTTLQVKLTNSGSSGLSKKYLWRLQHVDSSSGVTARSVDDVWSVSGGPQVGVTLETPGRQFVLSVQNLGDDGTVLAEGRAVASCKYVRREIRKLAEGDREAFFDAMQIFFTISTEEGKIKYGSKFRNHEKIVTVHEAQLTEFCFHNGMQFMTSHAAFDLVFERYLQMINPRVALPLWDFMIEAATMGDEWYNSIIFDKEWFGSALGSPDNNFMVSEGRFGNISTIYDPEKRWARSRVHPNYNPYGYVSSVNNYNDMPRLTRTTSFCGLTSHGTFATAGVFIACFEEHTTFDNWENCMEQKVHGDLHGIIGGGFNCNTDMKQFADDHPQYSVRLLSFLLEYITFGFWPQNLFMPNGNTCDTACDQGEPCGCTCNVDAFAISDQETYFYCEYFMSQAAQKFSGDEFITYDADAPHPYGFMKGDERMSDEDALYLMRYLVKIGCEPGAVGAMSTGTSALDPIFWVLHGFFEKALHILWLSPKYREAYDMEWVDGTCNGSGYNDELPFTESILGLGSGKTFLTNKRILELLYPTNVNMPYIYEGFHNWGNFDTDLVKN